MSNILFQDVTNTSNTVGEGQSFGLSWGDFNGDALPDLWVSNHIKTPSLFINQGDGSFINSISTSFDAIPSGDQHGAAWSDFDNDGDQDLVQLIGAASGTGSEPNAFYVNDEGQLKNQASRLGVEYASSRSRTPFWLDYNNDGLLDLGNVSIRRPDGQAPSTILRQTQTGFEDARLETNFQLNTSTSCSLSDLFGSGSLDIVCQGTPTSNTAITRQGTRDTPFSLSDLISVPDSQWTRDISISDFNGDLKPDIYLARHQVSSTVQQTNANKFNASLLSLNSEHGVTFKTSGDLILSLFTKVFSTNDIYIGSAGLHPNRKAFTLDPENAANHGIFEHTPGVDRGIYLGYDPDTSTWQFLQSGPKSNRLTASFQSTTDIQDLTEIGFESSDALIQDKLYLNTGEGFVDGTEQAGLAEISTTSNRVVSGDFDNDTDVDLYVVESGDAANKANRLYENQGDGTFTVVENAGGASGTTLGVGENVATADYDLDGFLDLFITNGEGPPPNANDGVNQLFRNQGNQNHWLEMDLEGILSNRDGIGAQVYVKAGGITQLREANGGIHTFAQNHQRLHFGLADNNIIESIEIRWPSGTVQLLENLPADQLLRVVEPTGDFAPGPTNFVIGEDLGVFLWKDTFDGPYRLRTLGSGSLSQANSYDINLISTEKPLNITPVNLNANDTLTSTEFGFSLASEVTTFQDGVDFQLEPGAKALFSVTQNEVANPRQLHIGGDRVPLSPAGWILNSEAFGPRPNYTPGQDLGLFVGRGNMDNVLEFRWSGDAQLHQSDLTVLSSDSSALFEPFLLESPQDQVSSFDNGIQVQGAISTGDDDLNVVLQEPVDLGFSYRQDSLFQSQSINPFSNRFGLPNAYELPLASPFGKPDINSLQEQNLFLWKDERTEFWHLQATAGGYIAQYTGSIVADSAAEAVDQVGLESSDQVNIQNPTRIDFDLTVTGQSTDEIMFRFPDETNLSLQLSGGAAPLRIGAQEWEVSQVPLDLSGWG